MTQAEQATQGDVHPEAHSGNTGAPDRQARKPFPVQFGSSSEADFADGTWTFNMHGRFVVGAGGFAIVPRALYDELIAGARHFMAYETAMQADDHIAGMQHYADAADRLRAALTKATGSAS